MKNPVRKKLPKGLCIGRRRDGRAKPFFVRFGPRRLTVGFAVEAERDKAALRLAELYRTNRPAALEFDPVQWIRFQQFLKKWGMTLDEIEVVLEQLLQAGAGGSNATNT